MQESQESLKVRLKVSYKGNCTVEGESQIQNIAFKILGHDIEMLDMI